MDATYATTKCQDDNGGKSVKQQTVKAMPVNNQPAVLGIIQHAIAGPVVNMLQQALNQETMVDSLTKGE